MNWNRVMNAHSYAAAREMFFQSIALIGADHVQVPDRFGVSHRVRRYDSSLLQQAAIALGVLPTCLIPLVQVAQLDAQDGCLQRVEATVKTAEHVLIFFLLAIVP